jgi:hypothetical protein
MSINSMASSADLPRHGAPAAWALPLNVLDRHETVTVAPADLHVRADVREDADVDVLKRPARTNSLVPSNLGDARPEFERPLQMLLLHDLLDRRARPQSAAAWELCPCRGPARLDDRLCQATPGFCDAWGCRRYQSPAQSPAS